MSNHSSYRQVLSTKPFRFLWFGQICSQFAVNTPTGITSKLQGYSYESSGTTEIGLTRNIIVYQQYRAASSLFDFAVYSQQGSFRSQ